MDINALIGSAWKITRSQRTLWAIGMLTVLAPFLLVSVALMPLLSPLIAGTGAGWLERPALLAGWLFLLLLTSAVALLLTPLLQGSLVFGIFSAQQGEEGLGLSALLAAGSRFYARFLGIMALFAAVAMAINTLIIGIQLVGTLVTLGLAAICMMPLALLAYPILYAGMAWLELAEAAIVVDGLGVMDAARRAWRVMLQSKMAVFVLAILLFVVVGMVALPFFAPLMLPLTALPFAGSGSDVGGVILIGTGLLTLLYLPALAFLIGGINVFAKAGWVLAFVQLAHKTDSTSSADLAP